MKYIILLIALTFSQLTIAQDNLSQSFIEERYKGGTEAFANQITPALNYSKPAKENDYLTIAIVYLDIDENGLLEYIEVVNKIKYGLDESIKSAFLNHKENWLPSENGYAHFIAITYSLFDNYAKVIRVNYPDVISENILVNAYKKDQDSTIRASISYKDLFQKNESGFDKNMRKEYFRKSKFYLSNLIEMDPFYPEYYKNRLNIESYTKIYDYACDDLRILKSIWNIGIKKMKVKCD